MSAHTPGPWQRIGCAIAADELDVARIYMPRGMSDDTCRANASLIAAAPELLEAARQAESDFAWAERTVAGTNFQASLILLRAAIAKATGGQP